MSFRNYVYEADNGVTYKLRLSSAGFAAHPGTKPAVGTTDTGISCNVSGNRNVAGMHARGLRLTRTVTEGDLSKSFGTFLPIATQATWNGVADGAAISVDGVAYTVAGKVAERQR